ncbi:MAG TPA: hypothetical protein VFH61_05350 [Thermoleophilia bacterium]|nr:hypothetical protein [Thermoleophilia bacterium]
MSRHPHDIVPRDEKDEVLRAIYDELVGLRADVQTLRAEPAAADPREVTPRPAPAPKKTAPKKPAAKKPAVRKKTSP